VAAPRLLKRNAKLGIEVDRLMSADGIDMLGSTA
jgi:hypothetical protein